MTTTLSHPNYIIHAFVYPSKSNIGPGRKWDPAEEKPCKTFVSCFINIKQSFSAVANALSVNKREWIQEVASRMQFISRDSSSANCVLATESLHQPYKNVCAGRLQLFYQSEMEASGCATLQLSAINKSHHICSFLILLVLLPTEKWDLRSILYTSCNWFLGSAAFFSSCKMTTRSEGLQQSAAASSIIVTKWSQSKIKRTNAPLA